MAPPQVLAFGLLLAAATASFAAAQKGEARTWSRVVELGWAGGQRRAAPETGTIGRGPRSRAFQPGDRTARPCPGSGPPSGRKWRGGAHSRGPGEQPHFAALLASVGKWTGAEAGTGGERSGHVQGFLRPPNRCLAPWRTDLLRSGRTWGSKTAPAGGRVSATRTSWPALVLVTDSGPRMWASGGDRCPHGGLQGRYAPARARRPGLHGACGCFPFSKDHMSNAKLIVGNAEITITVKSKNL